MWTALPQQCIRLLLVHKPPITLIRAVSHTIGSFQPLLQPPPPTNRPTSNMDGSRQQGAGGAAQQGGERPTGVHRLSPSLFLWPLALPLSFPASSSSSIPVPPQALLACLLPALQARPQATRSPQSMSGSSWRPQRLTGTARWRWQMQHQWQPAARHAPRRWVCGVGWELATADMQ